MMPLFFLLGCGTPQTCKCPPPRDCQVWKNRVARLEEELTLEKVKVARLQGLLELEGARSLPLPGGPQNSQEAREALGVSSSWIPPLFARAYREMENGQHERALEDFGAFIRAYPRHPLSDDALYFMAREEANLGNREGALDLLRRLIEDYPGSDRISQAKLKMGLILIREGRIKEGEKVIKDVLGESPFVLEEGEAQSLLKGEEK